MAAETLIFDCPRCHVRLKVPASLAGVTGPCPGCREQITAPLPDVPPVAVSGGAAAPEPARTPVVPAGPADPGGSPRLRPEPRHLPERAPSLAIKPTRSTEDPQLSRGPAPPDFASGRRSYRLIHAVVPASFLVLAATIVGTLLYHYGPGAPAQRAANASRPLEVEPMMVPARPAVQPVESPPVETPAREPTPPPRPADESQMHVGKSPAVIANELLDAFLAAPDAATRVGMVEPAATEQELAATLLKGPLPDVARITPELPQQRPEEQVTDFPYRVTFFEKDAPTVEFAVLVRQRGTQPPKLFLPAFLDLVGGHLAEFTRQPNQLPPATFHVHLEPIDGCYEKDIPGADRKFTLKLLPGPFSRETARAYAANVSRFRTQVESPSYPIRWGMRRRATVTIQWNHKEDPAHPYLELIDINSPDWNP